MGKQSDKQETAYNDVSKELEEAQALAQQPPKFDKDGQLVPVDSDAVRKVSEENMVRAAGAANGGGPWPQDLLREVGTAPLRAEAARPEYTSHQA